MANELVEVIYDITTKKTTIRDFNQEEIANHNKEKLFLEKLQAEHDAEAEVKSTAKAALLQLLGITADEAALLLS
jgi:hypothetical protein